MKKYYVYILTNKYNAVLYTGVTSNLNRRIFEHKNKLVDGFTKKYNINKLIFVETFNSIEEAIEKVAGLTYCSAKELARLISKLSKMHTL